MPKIRNKKNGSLDEVTDQQWADMHKVEPGMSRTLASLFDVVSPQPMPEEVRVAMEGKQTNQEFALKALEDLKAAVIQTPAEEFKKKKK